MNITDKYATGNPLDKDELERRIAHQFLFAKFGGCTDTLEKFADIVDLPEGMNTLLSHCEVSGDGVIFNFRLNGTGAVKGYLKGEIEFSFQFCESTLRHNLSKFLHDFYREAEAGAAAQGKKDE